MQGYPDAASAGRASAESALYCISVPLVRSYAVACIWALPLLKRQAQSLLCTVPLVRSYAVASRAARFMLVVPSMRGTCAYAWNPSYAHDGGSASDSNVSGNDIVRFSSTTLRPTEFSSLTIECLKV